VIKTFEVQLLPNPDQAVHLAQHVGAVRWLWNQMLDRNIKRYEAEHKFIFRYEMQRLLPDLKKSYPWLGEINSQSLQMQCDNLNSAISRKIKNKKSTGFPKFKSKHDCNDSFVVPQHFGICNRSIKLPKIGRIKYIKQRPFEGKAKRIVVVKRDDNKWFALISCELPDITRSDFAESEIIGLDVGIKDFAILSDGTKITNPRHFVNSQKLLKRKQKSLSRKCKGSKNRAKARNQVRNLYKKIRNQVADFQWKTADSIAKNYAVVAMEDLNIAGMVRNRRLAKHIASAGWGLFKTRLNHQLAKRGGFVVDIPRFAPSSKMCNSCGVLNEGLMLSDRVWICTACGETHDRDVNAAVNIRQFGIGELVGKGTCRIYACRDNSAGDVVTQHETMSLKQESESSSDDPTCCLHKW
jgi:putative transposase